MKRRGAVLIDAAGLFCLGLGLLTGVLIDVLLIPFLFAATWGRALARRLRTHRQPAWKEDAWLRRD